MRPAGKSICEREQSHGPLFRFGPGAVKVPPPLLHAGTRLPIEVIRATSEILSRFDVMPDEVTWIRRSANAMASVGAVLRR